ncbi:MAG: imidazole glycerol phosphate synthase subunit HisH [Actinobacteria bacterium]|nr:imidazole glycerol phosphate synthase subunit HisH [Actinomycetota bacterium]NDE12107.1 imidazole glycerol phosphate synthase subunit HisH [Actinomycetota bacterium]
MIAILDYGSGNIRSAQRAIERLGVSTEVTSEYEVALNAAGLLVPGVGAFGSCIRQLLQINGDLILKERLKLNRPTLGVCVGMQILFESSAESDEAGLALVAGKVKKLSAKILPHIGWNEVHAEKEMNLMRGLNNQRFYFVHSYAATTAPDEFLQAKSNYGEEFVAAIQSGSLSAVQFHPEKSGDAGMQLLKNWVSAL